MARSMVQFLWPPLARYMEFAMPISSVTMPGTRDHDLTDLAYVI